MVLGILVASVVVFSGGDLADFTQQYAKHANEAVVIAAERPAPPLEFNVPFDFDAKLSRHAAEYVAEHIDCVPYFLESSAVDGCHYHVFRPRKLPLWLAPGWSQKTFEAYDKAFPVEAGGLGRDGPGVKPTCEVGKYRTGESLEYGRFAKPVKVHWLLRHFHFVAAGVFYTEEDYLRCVATAIGGRLVVSKDAYIVDLDPSIYRQELAEYWRDRRGGFYPTQYGALRSVDFWIAALNALTPGQISEAMRTEKSYVNVETPQDSPVGRFASALLEACLYDGSDPSSKERKINEESKAYLDLGDLTKPYVVLMSAQRGIKLRILARAGDGGMLEP